MNSKHFGRLLVFGVALCLLSLPSHAETGTVLILYTNDLHDHIRPGYEGVGGMPYISGYIKDVKSQRQDVLVLDAGDVTEKGDMVAFETHSDIMYEAMGRIGYAATVPGNHDLDHGVSQLHVWEGLARGTSMLCLNCVDKDRKPCFPPSRVFDVNGVKVGVIGLTILKDNESMDRETSVEALRREAERLRSETHLLVALCHAGSKDCADLSRLVPSIQVFVGGHTHELIEEPMVVADTDALIVQAGEYARHVGRLELTVDRSSRKLMHAEGIVVEMRHDKTPCDEEMAEWVRKREQEVCPEATHVVGRCEKPLGLAEAAVLAAAALRWRAAADVALCHTATIIRSGLPAGDIDVNALFLTGGQRGAKVLGVRLTGKAIESYLEGLMNYEKGRNEWAGFHGAIERSESDGAWVAHTDLDPDKTYTVVVCEQEWVKRFETVTRKQSKQDVGAPSAPPIEPQECPFTFIEALAAYAEDLAKEGVLLDEHVRRLTSARQLLPEPVR